MTLDADLRPIVDLAAAVEGVEPSEETVAELRESFAGLAAILGAGDAAVSTADHALPGPAGDVPVRAYRPPQAPQGRTIGALVWFHGGGWVIGDLDTHDALCRDIAAASGRAVVAVDYRRAPEHRFPAAHDDATAAVEWLLDNGAQLGVDPARIAVGGDSAGGHLATVVARRLRDRRRSGGSALPVAQVLVYPVTDTAGTPTEHPSRIEHADGLLLTGQLMDFFTDAYLPDPADRLGDDASPLRAADLRDLPPALVVVAGYDVLRDEGLAYAERLTSAGVSTEVVHLEGAIHLCAQMPSTGAGRRITDEVGRFLADRLA